MGIYADSLMWSIKKPARERVAQRIIAVAQRENYTSGSEVLLRKGEYYLSDNGPVYYYTEGTVSAVEFRDFSGILHGTGTLYVSDPKGALPAGADRNYDYRHKSGHWWVGAG